MTPWKSLALWLLLLLQEPYLCINSYYRNLGHKIYTAILKNHMQRTLDAIIAEKRSAAIKSRTILHIFSTIRDIIDVSQFKQQLCLSIFEFWWAFYGVGWDFMLFVNFLCHKFVIRKFILPFSSLVMEINLFATLKLCTPKSNLKLKTWSAICT